MVGNGRHEHVAGLAAGGLLLAVGAPAVEEPNFGMELDRVREAMHVEPAKAYYDGPFNKAFYARFSLEGLNQCTKSTGEPLSDFDMLITLGGEGQVQALRFEVKSSLAGCFGDLVRKDVSHRLLQVG